MFSFKLFSQLPRGPEELGDHIVALKRMTNAHEHQAIFEHLYSCLSILDAKSSSLLTFNSIILAVFAIILPSTHGSSQWIAINTGMVTVLVSSLLLLSVVWVHWSTTDDLQDLEHHALTLLDVRRFRTIKYRLAWYLAVAAVFSLCAFLLLRVINRALT